jgi:two-component system sensor kinase FixL
VITNLLRNSIDALDEVDRREIVLATRLAPPDGVEIAVADSGPGLDPEVARRLFQPFVTTKPGGIGIGLSICRSIVEAHGGQIGFANKATAGAVFRFTLPAQ